MISYSQSTERSPAVVPDRCYVALARGDVHVRRYGDAERPLVLVHDSPGSGACVDAMASALSGSFQVFVVDRPGHGATSIDTSTIETSASVVAQALRALGVRRAPAAGSGIGAEVAASLAHQAPDVCSAALVHEGWNAPVEPEKTGRSENNQTGWDGSGGGALVDAWWVARRTSMFRPWWSESAADRIALTLPPAAALHAIAIDLMARPGSGTAPSSRPAPLGDKALRKLTTWSPDAVAAGLDGLPAGVVTAPAAPGSHTGLRSAYVGTRPDLVHLSCAQPEPGAATRRAIVLLAPAPGSSASLHNLVSALGSTCRVFAPDYPGHGRSDPMPDSAAGLDAYLDVLEDTAGRLGLGPVNLYGQHSGALLAALWQRRHPKRVHALALDGVPLGSAFRGYDLDAYLPSLAPDAAGHHVLAAWAMANDRVLWSPWHQQAAGTATSEREASSSQLTAWTIDLLRGAYTYHRLYRLVLSYALEDELPQPAPVPTLLCQTPCDPLARYVDRVRPLFPRAQLSPSWGHATPTAAARTADLLSDFFDRSERALELL